MDKLDLDLDIGSKEQLSVDQLTRSRLQFALGQNQSIIQQTQFADAKAATLLALTGVLALAVTGEAVPVAREFVAGLLGLTILVIGICLMALLPRVAPRKTVESLHEIDRFSWPALTADGYAADAHAEFLRTSQASQLVMAVARSNAAIAKILARKYLYLRTALILAMVDLTAILAAAGYGFVTGSATP